MRDFDLTMCVGPAGTGKTYLAVAAALESLHRQQVKRLVLVRPAVEAGEKLGFLPGDLQAKVHPFVRPLLDALRDMLDFGQVRTYMDNDIVEIAPLAYMRGRTLNDSFIILDEGQNTTIPQMKMFLTRIIGRASRHRRYHASRSAHHQECSSLMPPLRNRSTASPLCDGRYRCHPLSRRRGAYEEGRADAMPATDSWMRRVEP